MGLWLRMGKRRSGRFRGLPWALVAPAGGTRDRDAESRLQRLTRRTSGKGAHARRCAPHARGARAVLPPGTGRQDKGRLVGETPGGVPSRSAVQRLPVRDTTWRRQGQGLPRAFLPALASSRRVGHGRPPGTGPEAAHGRPSVQGTGEAGGCERGGKPPPTSRTLSAEINHSGTNDRHGVPGGIRTHGPQIRNLVLYPAELRGHRRLLSTLRGAPA